MRKASTCEGSSSKLKDIVSPLFIAYVNDLNSMSSVFCGCPTLVITLSFTVKVGLRSVMPLLWLKLTLGKSMGAAKILLFKPKDAEELIINTINALMIATFLILLY